MTTTSSNSERDPPRRRWAVPAAAALAAGYLCWILAHFAPAIMSPDANGYVVQARLLATAGRTFLRTESPAQYVGTHWLETTDGVFQSRYPAGLPLLAAAVWKLGGLPAALLVNPLLASGTILLTFFLARRFADDGSALLAAAVLATNATAQQHALDADAHTAAGFFLTAGLVALWHFADRPTWGRGLLAGLFLGTVPTVRYPEALAAVALGLWLLGRVRPLGRVVPAVVGAAIPVGALLIHNAAAYGAFWRTGYALTGEQTGFGWGYFTAHALSYLQNLGGEGLGLFFAFGVAGLAGLAADRRHRADGLLLAGIAVPMVLLYMAYYFDGGGGSLRFLIPTFPLFAAGAAWLLTRIRESLGGAGWAVWAAVAVVQLGAGGAAAAEAVARTGSSLHAAAQLRQRLEQVAPPGSIVIADHALAESLDATGEWRLVEGSLVTGNRWGGPGGGPMGRPGPGGRGGPRGPGGPRPGGAGQPSPEQAGKNRAQHARYDRVPDAERERRIWTDVRAWSGTRSIFWLARSLDEVESALPDGADCQSVGEMVAPALAAGGGGGRGPGGGPPGFRGPDGGGPPFGADRGGPDGGPARVRTLQLVRIDFRPSPAAR